MKNKPCGDCDYAGGDVLRELPRCVLTGRVIEDSYIVPIWCPLKKRAIVKFQEAFKIFTKELRRDKSLYQTYQANIAMAYFDCAHWEGSRDSCKKRHAIGNRAADHFLGLLLKPIRPQGKKILKPTPPN